MTAPVSPMLELVNLVKDFDTKRAVDRVSFSLQRGRILGLLGPNGAGKTTTIRMIMNIIAPDSGEIRILGERFSETLKDRIGYLPEERGLYRKMTIKENLDFFGRLKGMDRKKITSRGNDLLEEFDLIQHRERRMEELSKGMSQKLQFIIAILHTPDLLILDEPFSGLDPVNIEKVKNCILEQKRRRVSIIFSTHLMAYAEKIVDTVVMIHQGRKVLDGSLSSIRAQHGRRLARIVYDGEGAFVSGLNYVHSVADYGREMEIELASDDYRQRLLRDLVTHLDIHHFEMSDPSLHSIFLRKAEIKSQDDLNMEGRE
ncbi:MAG TPA: ATP-binding cassette domain-containing protein [Candidatus Aminicenantes bacterium]|nr:ATP-binding cassette domain-containing protein [Candidatus Aminicenantes bacterium]